MHWNAERTTKFKVRSFTLFVRFVFFLLFAQKGRVTKALYFHLIFSALHQFNSCILARVVTSPILSTPSHCHTSSIPKYRISIHDASMEATNSYNKADEKTYLPPEWKKGKQFSNWHINYVYFADAPIFIECDQI